MHQFVHDDMREKRLEREILLVAGGENRLRDRDERLCELGILHVLQHHALGALLADYALVVREIEGRRLHAPIGVAGGEDLVDDDDRREGAELRIAVLRVDRQVILDILQLAGELLQLGRLRFVDNRYERFESRLVVEQLVLVHLVGSDRRLDGALHLHPRDVAVVVVVGQERVGAFCQKCFESRFAGQI